MGTLLNLLNTTGFAALIGVFGVVVGVVLERFLRAYGKVICEFSDWSFEACVLDKEEDLYGDIGETCVEASPLDLRRDEFVSSDFFRFRFTVRFFNSKDLPIGMSQPRLAFLTGSKLLAEVPMDDLDTWKSGTGAFGPTVESLNALNIPPREYVQKRLKGTVADRKDQKISVTYCDRVELRARTPEWWQRDFRKRLPSDSITIDEI